jgi:UDP-N-acetylglucosamine/UDP-N-acetylgalactosamine diphosphorylase
VLIEATLRIARAQDARRLAQVREDASDLPALRARYEEHGQGHVFAHADVLDSAGRARLAAQLAAIDPAALADTFEAALRLAHGERERLEPAPIERLPEHGGSEEWREAARARGRELLAEGAVAALVVAGGQGTRLGFAGPKGAFPLGPVTSRSLFAQQAQKLRRAETRFGRRIPWLVMTSPATDAETRALFAESAHFGLAPRDVAFFVQGAMPAVDFEGRLLLEAPDRVATAPDGHGGVFAGLANADLFSWLRDRGVRLLTYYQVDNPLVPILDPLFLGFHDLRGAEMSAKVVAKRTPEERAGTVGTRGGRVRVLEYTEVDPWHRDERGPDGELVFWAGSIAIHVLDVAFAERIAERAGALLPCHVSPKKIPGIDRDGRPLVPDAPNGYKLERFVFDALPEARRAALLEVRRHEEYSPIKNRTGNESPCTARTDLVANYHRWLAAAGVEVAADAWIELDESRIGPPDGAAAVPFEPPRAADWILFGSRGTS